MCFFFCRLSRSHRSRIARSRGPASPPMAPCGSPQWSRRGKSLMPTSDPPDATVRALPRISSCGPNGPPMPPRISSCGPNGPPTSPRTTPFQRPTRAPRRPHRNSPTTRRHQCRRWRREQPAARPKHGRCAPTPSTQAPNRGSGRWRRRRFRWWCDGATSARFDRPTPSQAHPPARSSGNKRYPPRGPSAGAQLVAPPPAQLHFQPLAAASAAVNRIGRPSRIPPQQRIHNGLRGYLGLHRSPAVQ